MWKKTPRTSEGGDEKTSLVCLFPPLFLSDGGRRCAPRGVSFFGKDAACPAHARCGRAGRGGIERDPCVEPAADVPCPGPLRAAICSQKRRAIRLDTEQTVRGRTPVHSPPRAPNGGLPQTGMELDTLEYFARPYSVQESGGKMARMWSAYYKSAKMIIVRGGGGRGAARRPPHQTGSTLWTPRAGSSSPTR